MRMRVLPACMLVYHVQVCMTMEAKRGHLISGVKNGCKPPHHVGAGN